MPEEEVIIEEEDKKTGGITEDDKISESEVESLAKEMGWRPKEDFSGDKADFVDAESYIKKGQDIQDSMRKSLKDQKRQLSDMFSSLTELKTHNERVYKADVKRLEKDLVSLRAEKKEAIEDGDVEKVNEIDEEIDTVRESISPVEEQPSQSVSPDFEDWLKDNRWYADNEEMADFADSIAVENRDLSFKRKAALAKKRVMEAFPENFKTEPTISRVESATRRGTESNFTEANLTSEQKAIMNQFVRQGILTKKQYLEDIAKTAGA